MSKFWQNIKQWSTKKQQEEDLNRSRYSLVSTRDLTKESLDLWLDLPDEVKNDPMLEQFKTFYEKENDNKEKPSKRTKEKPAKLNKIHLVKSAPVLQCEDEISELDVMSFTAEDKDEREVEEKIINTGAKTPQTKACTLSVVNKMVNSMSALTQPSMARALFLIKMSVLLACWLFFTSAFLLHGEKKEVMLNTALKVGEIKKYPLTTEVTDTSVSVTLSGPFITEQMEIKMNSTNLGYLDNMAVWIGGGEDQNIFKSPPWTIYLQDPEKLDFNEGESRSHKFKLPSNSNLTYFIMMNSTAQKTLPFAISYSVNPIDVTTGVIYALVLLCGLYILIIFEIISRTMAAVTISTLSLATLALNDQRPSLQELVSWLDAETLLLLFSMMVLVAIMAETGIFDFLAVFAFEVTKGRLWPLIFLLCGITAFLSTFLDNVTTVLLMSPVTIRLCEVMDLDPVPILMFMSIFSNIGGAATPVGDPPNVIVASNKAVIQAGINFTNFTAHMSLGVLLVCVQTALQIRFMFRDTNRLRLNEPRDIQDLRSQITIWRRAAESLPHLSKDVHVVRERLERKIRKLSLQLTSLVKESSKRACPKEAYSSTLLDLKEKYKIRDRVLLAKAVVAISFVVIMFFLHSIPELNRISLGWTALLGAILLLLLADRQDIEPILHRVEWSTLIFFGALFVLMEALSKLGLILYIGGLMEQLIMTVDETYRLAVAILLIVWTSGVISALVDNIPLSTMMVRVVVTIGSNPAIDLPMSPVIWALLFGASLGGNGTLIGASANVVCAGVAEQHGYKFTFSRFFKVGFPIMIGHLIVASVYLLACHCVFTWH